MSLTELREQNRNKVLETALICFVENGIENTKVSDIAVKAGLTHRSIYRYFETKADIVLASSLLFWHQIVEETRNDNNGIELQNLSNKEKITNILKSYARQYIKNKDKLIFISEAELYLYRSGMLQLLQNKPPEKFENQKAPLSIAIHKEIEAGNITISYAKAKRFYYNAYDGLLGLLQKLSILLPQQKKTEEEVLLRLYEFCEIIAESFYN